MKNIRSENKTITVRKLAWIGIMSLLITVFGCKHEEHHFDASGAFEAEEIIVSAQAQGEILQLKNDEGSLLKGGEQIGFIDSTQLSLQKQQLQSQILALLGKKPDIPVQLAILRSQLKSAEHEKERIANLVKGDAATPKQLDDIQAHIATLRSQIDAQQSTLSINSRGIGKEVIPLKIQIEQIDNQISKCHIVNPITGTVLTTYTKAHEMASPGKPLYKIADLSSLILRVYISGDQLAKIRLNEEVTVLTDDSKSGYFKDKGTVTWISDKAEFTPKTIQTKDERANLVYAVKIRVKNDGRYKIGMYGEILLHK